MALASQRHDAGWAAPRAHPRRVTLGRCREAIRVRFGRFGRAGNSAAHQVRVPGSLADAVDARVDPRVLPRVQIAQRPGYRVGHGHAQVVVAVRLDRDAHRGRQLGEALPDPLRAVAADRVAVPDPVGAGIPRGQRELQQEPVIGPRAVLGVDADGFRAAVPGGRDRRGHLGDDGLPVQPARGTSARSSGPTWRSTGCNAAAAVRPGASPPRWRRPRRHRPVTARHQPDSRSEPNAPASASARLARTYGTSWNRNGKPISDCATPSRPR